jgi:hypothetical protein
MTSTDKKARVRERMANTGESYTQARRAIEQSPPGRQNALLRTGPEAQHAAVDQCILCGATDPEWTREHVIPGWARRAFDIRGPVTVNRSAEPDLQLRSRIDEIQHLNITLDSAICKDCNTVWLRRLEDDVRPFLKPMAVSNKPTTLDAGRQMVLATWAVKTVLLFETAVRQMYPDGRPIMGYLASRQELAWLRTKREPPPRSLVWLGCWDSQQSTPVMYAPSDAPLPTADGIPVASSRVVYRPAR